MQTNLRQVIVSLSLWLGTLSVDPVSAWVQLPELPYPDGNPRVVLHWFCQKSRCDPELVGPAGQDIIRRAIHQWNGAGSQFMFRTRPAQHGDDPCTIFGEVVVILTEDGRLCRSDGPMVSGPHAGLMEYDHGLRSARVYIKIDRRRTNIFERLVFALLLHELGHVAGLDHPDRAGQNVLAVMNSGVFPFEDLMLYPDDIAGLQALYPLQVEPEPDMLVGFLENPRNGSTQSGVGVISGWVCEAEEVEIVFWPVRGGQVIRKPAAYGTERLDTDYTDDGREICGDTNNGFGLLFNWNLLVEKEYDISARVDGEILGRARITLTHLGQEFLRGVQGRYVLENFPYPGESVVVEWEQSLQNFVIIERR